jgi:hypothetical protein
LQRELRKFRQNCKSAKEWKSKVAANMEKQTLKSKVGSPRFESQSEQTRMINSYENSNNSNDVIAHHSSPPSCLLVPSKHHFVRWWRQNSKISTFDFCRSWADCVESGLLTV